MSSMLDAADAIKARLEAQATLAGVDVIVDRQKDILSAVAAAIGKTKGNAITILWEGFGVPDPNTSGPRILSRYSIRTWSMPVVERARKAPGDVILADTIVVSICKALHHWMPTEAHIFGEMTVTGGDLVPDPRWLSYEINAEIQLSL
jgi:hypothetical protein